MVTEKADDRGIHRAEEAAIQLARRVVKGDELLTAIALRRGAQKILDALREREGRHSSDCAPKSRCRGLG